MIDTFRGKNQEKNLTEKALVCVGWHFSMNGGGENSIHQTNDMKLQKVNLLPARHLWKPGWAHMNCTQLLGLNSAADKDCSPARLTPIDWWWAKNITSLRGILYRDTPLKACLIFNFSVIFSGVNRAGNSQKHRRVSLWDVLHFCYGCVACAGMHIPAGPLKCWWKAGSLLHFTRTLCTTRSAQLPL